MRNTRTGSVRREPHEFLRGLTFKFLYYSSFFIIQVSPFLRFCVSWRAYSELSFYENSFNKLSISRQTNPYLLLICSECWTSSTPGGPINIILGGFRGALLSLSIRCLAISSTIFFFYKSLPSSSIIPPLNYYLTPSILTRYSVIASLAI